MVSEFEAGTTSVTSSAYLTLKYINQTYSHVPFICNGCI